jgi:hypothetical protein
MDDPENPTDSTYETARRKAEQCFLVASDDWVNAVTAEFRLPTQPPPSDLNSLMANAPPGATSDHTEAATPKTFGRLKLKLRRKLVELCREYAMAELRAYVALLDRLGIPPSRIVAKVEEHAIDILKEIRERKWLASIRQIWMLFDVSSWIELRWGVVEEDVQSFTHVTLAKEIWSRDESHNRKNKRGRPQIIPDKLKAEASALKAHGGSYREVAVKLYRTKHPTPQQVKNVYSILRHYGRKVAKQSLSGPEHAKPSQGTYKNKG